MKTKTRTRYIRRGRHIFDTQTGRIAKTCASEAQATTDAVELNKIHRARSRRW